MVRFVAFNADRGYSRNYLKSRHRALRTFLRFLHVHGMNGRLLSGAVPPVATWSLSTVPRGAEQAQVQALLASFDLATATGLRDRAIVLMMARLGLRCIEVARLRFGDIDWHAGTFTVAGKAGQVEELPLLTEVGGALREYLLYARAQCSCEEVFVTLRRPLRPINPGVIAALMGRAGTDASIGHVSAHQLRHTVAIQMLESGSGLAEIGQVLRHHSAMATAIYAKVDLRRLWTLARPWPEGR